MKRILITGAGSYLGKSLRQFLLQWPERYQVDSVSVRDDSWHSMRFRGYDAIYHTAALVHLEQNKQDPRQAEAYDRVNARLPVALAEKARAEGVGQFLFLSTAAVYGITAPYGKTILITKDTPLNPTDNYGISKAKAESGLLALETEAFRIAILRPPMIYGKECKGNFRALEAMARTLPVFPDIRNQRSMLYVGNLNRLVQLIIDNNDHGIFLPQNSAYVSTSRMVQQIAAAKGKKLPLLPGFGWTLHILRRVSPKVDKAFGSLCYDMSLSRYREDYCVTDFETSILESET